MPQVIPMIILLVFLFIFIDRILARLQFFCSDKPATEQSHVPRSLLLIIAIPLRQISVRPPWGKYPMSPTPLAPHFDWLATTTTGVKLSSFLVVAFRPD